MTSLEHGHEPERPAPTSTRQASTGMQHADSMYLTDSGDISLELYSLPRLLELQSAVGNAAIGGLMRQVTRRDRLPVQRHNPTGADPEAVIASIGGTGTAPATPVTATATPVTAAPLPAAKVDPAAALNVLQGSFGSIKKLTSTKIVALPLADIQAAYATDCNDRGAKFKDKDGTERPWTAADASYVGGFYTDRTDTIYVNDHLPILGYVHELLHRNTAAGFDSLAGRPINEGTTDHLAVKACKAAGLTDYGPPGYVKEMDVVDRIIAIIGEDKLIQAYFSSAQVLVGSFDAAQGPGSYAQLRDAMDKGFPETIAYYSVPATVEAKIGRINDLFGGFFHSVSDEDIESMIGIVSSARNATEKAQLQDTVRGQVTSLNDMGQRARLRAGCDLT